MADIVITDLTRMYGTRICIAGYTLLEGKPVKCIRPELNYDALVESWLYSAEGVLRPFSVADFTLLRPRPAPPHVEDWIVERRYTLVTDFAPELVEPVMTLTCSASVWELYDGLAEYDHSWFVPARAETRSLGTIRPKRLVGLAHRWREERSKWDYRIGFDDESEERFWLPVTDLALRYFLDRRRVADHIGPIEAADAAFRLLNDGRTVFLRIGLTRPFGDFDRCFVQVTGVYTIPDYLDGKCHADFAPSLEDESPVVVPF